MSYYECKCCSATDDEPGLDEHDFVRCYCGATYCKHCKKDFMKTNDECQSCYEYEAEMDTRAMLNDWIARGG
jgi:hypothetical protein